MRVGQKITQDMDGGYIKEGANMNEQIASAIGGAVVGGCSFSGWCMKETTTKKHI